MATNGHDPYVLARNKVESNRLNDQHSIAVANFGYVIHPTILTRLPQNARIADVAAGTGAWALDAAQTLSSQAAQVVAYDVSSEQFPSSSLESVTFTVADAKQPFPEADQGTFDLVHVRALVCGLGDESDWHTVMRNIVQLLKPGGAIQWEEADLSSFRCFRGGEEFCEFKALPELLSKFESASKGQREGCSRLREVAVSQLCDVCMDVVSNDRVPQVREPQTRQFAVGMFGWAERFGVYSEQELEDIKKRVNEEIDNGVYTRGDMHAIVGRRPVTTAA